MERKIDGSKAKLTDVSEAYMEDVSERYREDVSDCLKAPKQSGGK